jgi:hypothetical protein
MPVRSYKRKHVQRHYDECLSSCKWMKAVPRHLTHLNTYMSLEY